MAKAEMQRDKTTTARETVTALANQIAEVRASLEQQYGDRAERTLQALSSGDMRGLEAMRQKITEDEHLLSDLRNAHSAASLHLSAAEAREQAEALRARWTAAHALVERRNAIGERLQGSLDDVAAGLTELRLIELEISNTLPKPPRFPPTHWGCGAHELMVQRHLAAFAAPMFGRARGLDAVCDMQAGPRLVDKIRASGEEVLGGNALAVQPEAA